MAAGVLNLFGQLVAAILCAAAGLIVWDIGTRSPAHVVADAIAATHSPRSLIRGIVRFFIGLLFVAISVVLVFLALPQNEFDRSLSYQTGAFITALVVELLIGNDVRPLLGLREGSRQA